VNRTESCQPGLAKQQTMTGPNEIAKTTGHNQLMVELTKLMVEAEDGDPKCN